MIRIVVALMVVMVGLLPTVAQAAGFTAHLSVSQLHALCRHHGDLAREAIGPGACAVSVPATGNKSSSAGFDTSAHRSLFLGAKDLSRVLEVALDDIEPGHVQELLDLGVPVTPPRLPYGLGFKPNQLIQPILPTDGEAPGWPGAPEPAIARFPPGCAEALTTQNGNLLSAEVDRKCLGTIDQIPQPYIDAGIGHVLVSLLVWDDDVRKPVCMGLRLEADLVLLADHCLFQDQDTDRMHTYIGKFYGSEHLRAAPAIRFVDKQLADRDYRIDLVGAKRIKGHDMALLPLRDDQEHPLPPAARGNQSILPVWAAQDLNPPADPLQATNILLMGPLDMFSVARLDETLRHSWQGYLRFTLAPQCAVRVRSETGSCALHTCQTTKTFSGAPLLFVKNNRLHVGGVHSRYDWPCGGIAQSLSKRVNWAASPTAFTTN